MNAGDDYPAIYGSVRSVPPIIYYPKVFSSQKCLPRQRTRSTEHLAFYGTQYMCQALSIYRVFKKGARLQRRSTSFSSSISLVEDSVATPMASLVDVPYFTFQSPLGNRISFFAQSAQLISLMHSGSRRKPKPIFSATLEERPIRHLLSLCCGTLVSTVEHFLMAP